MNYVLQTGDAGAERLRLLARVKGPTTLALLHRVGLADGMRCLDVGCGIGAVTLEMAQRVGPRGQAVGVDADADFIARARQEAARRGLPVEFEVAQAEALPSGPFDLVFARFLLTHLPDPLAGLRHMVAAARPGGLVVAEDIDFTGHFSQPPCPALQRYVELYTSVVARRGGDANLGPRLPELFRAAGLQDVHLEVVQPTFLDGEGKRVAAVTMAQIADAVVAAGLATAAEIAEVANSLEAFAAAPDTLMSLPRIFQVWGTRP